MKELTLNDFFANYPHITIANAADNKDILDFYHQRSLTSSKSEIIYERGEDFFAFLKERSHSSLVIIMRDYQGMMQGMGVLSFRPGYIHGKPVTVGYLGDLRVKLNRKLIREWRLMYASLMRLSPMMKETFYCSHYQTVLIDENIESQNNLAETKIDNLHYHRLARYKMVNIIGRVNLISYSHHIRMATSADRDLIFNFLKSKICRSLFAHDWTQEFARRLETWPNFDLGQYVLVFDQKGNLLAVTSLWNPGKSKQIKLTKISTTLKCLHKLLKIVPLVEVKKLPKENTAIDIMYLNQITFDDGLSTSEKKEITNEIVHFSFKQDFHMLAYADFENENYLEDSKTLFTQKMPMALYSVHFKEDAGEIVTPLSWMGEDATPTFDMSLV